MGYQKMVLKRIIKIAAVLLILAFASLPRLAAFPVNNEGIKLVPIIEQYKTEHGIYPETLTELGIPIKYKEKMRYERMDKEGEESFLLVCYGIWTYRTVYHSWDKTWGTIN